MPLYILSQEAAKQDKRELCDFFFEDISGTLVCVYYPDYMDGINAAGWHLHFISDDRQKGGHVFDLDMISGIAEECK